MTATLVVSAGLSTFPAEQPTRAELLRASARRRSRLLNSAHLGWPAVEHLSSARRRRRRAGELPLEGGLHRPGRRRGTPLIPQTGIGTCRPEGRMLSWSQILCGVAPTAVGEAVLTVAVSP